MPDAEPDQRQARIQGGTIAEIATTPVVVACSIGHDIPTASIPSESSRTRHRLSAETRAAAHAALRPAAALGHDGVASTTRHVSPDDAQEFRELGAPAMWALGLLGPANEQLDFPAARIA